MAAPVVTSSEASRATSRPHRLRRRPAAASSPLGVDDPTGDAGRRRRRAPRVRAAGAVRAVRRHARAAEEPGAGWRRPWRGSTSPTPLVRRRPDRVGRRGDRRRRRRPVPRVRTGAAQAGAVRRRDVSPTRASSRASAAGAGGDGAGHAGGHERARRRPRRSPAGRPCSSTRSTSTRSPRHRRRRRPRRELAVAGARRAAAMSWDASARPRSRCTARPPVADGLRVGVNLLWCLPGGVGGSEEYLARQLHGLADVAPEIDATLFVVPGFAAAHPDLAARHPLVVARSTPGAAAGASSPRRRGCRRGLHGVDVVHHGGGTVPPRSPQPGAAHDPRRPVPHVPATTYAAQAPVPAPRRPPRRSARPTSSPSLSEYVRSTILDGYRIDPDRVVVVPARRRRAGPTITPADELRARYGLGDRPLRRSTRR